MHRFEIAPGMAWLLGATMLVYVAGMYALGLWARRRVHDAEDFLVAGRRLPLSLAWATLLATWFGAGTVLIAADEVRHEGVRMAALDPLGAGVCLILAGVFFAGRLWKMRLLTLCDFFRRKFGRRAEVVSAIIMVPGYFGWIAAQFVALAGMLELFFAVPRPLGIVLVALAGMGYTLLGGMWSVTLTDAVQLVLVIVGLLAIAHATLSHLGAGYPGDGLARLVEETPDDMLAIIPAGSAAVVWGWLGVFLSGSLGNIPGQDLMQRVFAAKSAGVARGACWLAGLAYLAFGAVPVGLGLAAGLLFPDSIDSGILPVLAQVMLSPALAVIFTLALMSAILSTIDSAILSPSSVLAQNLFAQWKGATWSPLALNRTAVVIVTAASTALALWGGNAYELLEGAYALGLVGLFVPLAAGLYREPRSEHSATASMLVGMAVWLPQYLAGWEATLEPWAAVAVPVELAGAAAALVAYVLVEWASRGAPPSRD